MADLNGCLLNKDSKIAQELRAQTQCLENRGVHIETVNENTISLCRMVGGNITKTLENVVIVSFKVVDKLNQTSLLYDSKCCLHFKYSDCATMNSFYLKEFFPEKPNL